MLRDLERTAVALTLGAAGPLRAAVRSVGALRRRWRTLAGPARGARPTRVLVEVSTLDQGGLEEMVHDLVVNLDRTRFEPQVVCVRGGGAVAERLRERGDRVEVIEQSPNAYRAILLRERIDLVNSHYSTFGARLARAEGIPNVHVLHNSYTWLDDGGARRLAWQLRRMDRLVAVSSTVAGYAERRLHVPGRRIEVVPNGVEARRFKKPDREKARRALGLDAKAYVFLMVGTYEPRKGHRALLDAFSRVAQEHADALLVCAGSTKEASYLEECTRGLKGRGLEGRVRLLGFEERPERLYAAADAFVLPSVVEGFSLCTLEAAASGLPLILTAVGGAVDLLRRHDLGLLVPGYLGNLADATPEEIEQAQRSPPAAVVSGLADAMDEMCARPEKWRRVGASGPEIVAREYDVAVMARAYESLFAKYPHS